MGFCCISLGSQKMRSVYFCMTVNAVIFFGQDRCEQMATSAFQVHEVLVFPKVPDSGYVAMALMLIPSYYSFPSLNGLYWFIYCFVFLLVCMNSFLFATFVQAPEVTSNRRTCWISPPSTAPYMPAFGPCWGTGTGRPWGRSASTRPSPGTSERS